MMLNLLTSSGTCSTTDTGSKDNSLQAVELSGYQTCKLLSSHPFKKRFLYGFPDPSHFAAAKLTHYSTMPPDLRTPHDLGNASCSQVMCTRILVLLPSIHVPCVLATSQIVGCVICAIVVLVGFIRSVLVFKTQGSTVESRTGHASPADLHPLHQYRNRFHDQLQLKLMMGIPSPFCNSMQMASATNRLN